jgi:hypothetical protein
MQKLTSKDEEVYVFKKFLSKKECSKYFKMIKDIGYQSKNMPWDKRVVDITKDPIVNKITKFINKKFNLNLVVDQAEIQNHHINSSSELHIHDYLGREHITYNSLIYLNEDFEGGHFITKNGIKIKPKTGMLTFFNGQKIWHSVEKVLKKDRKTLIFWWKKNAI